MLKYFKGFFMKFKSLFLLILVVFLLGGCIGPFKKKNSPTEIIKLNIQQDVKEVSSTIEENSQTISDQNKSINERGNSIYEDSINVQNMIKEEDKKVFFPYMENIKTNSQEIISASENISISIAKIQTTSDVLNKVKNNVGIIENNLDKIKNERDEALKAKEKAETDRDSQLNRMLQWLIISCIVGAGIFGVVFIMYGSKLGIVGASCCAIVLVIAITVQSYMAYLAIAGAIILLGMVGVLIWQIWVQKKAFKEVVETVEITQDNLDPSIKEVIFGKDNENGLMNKVQSPTTMELVKKTKSSLPRLWDYAKNYKTTTISNGTVAANGTNNSTENTTNNSSIQ